MKNKKLLQLKRQLRDACGQIAEIRLEAIKADKPKLDRDCKIIWDATASVLHYVVNMIDEYKE